MNTTTNAIAGLLTLALGALPIMALATNAHAEVQPVRVQVADLDLNSIEGVTTFRQRADAATDKMCVANSPAQLTAAQACRVAVRAEINEKLALAQAAQANQSTQLASR